MGGGGRGISVINEHPPFYRLLSFKEKPIKNEYETVKLKMN